MQIRGKKNRVIQVTAKSGVQSVLSEHFKLLCKEGFDVILICSDDENVRHWARSIGVSFFPVLIKQSIAPISSVIGLFRLWRLFHCLQPTVVHAHGSKPGVLGMVASWLAQVPIRIYHNHGMALLSAKGWKYWLLRVTESLACRCATEVIFVSPSNREDIVNIGICPREKAVVLGPGTIRGIDTDKFDPRKHTFIGSQLRKKEGIRDNSWLVGFVGRIVPHKGIETILEAWRLLPLDIRSNAYLCIFGGYGHRRMQRLVQQAVADPDLHIRYMGFRDDMPAWYSVMTLLVQPSWHEGWGYNVLEAACSGVPAIGTRISATADAILDGETGVLVPVKDPKAMADAIVRILKDDNLRWRLGQAARERTIAEFQQDKICPLLIQEYRRLLSR